MSEAGHYEALRKERILQRKREWDRLSGSAGINTPRTDQQFLSDANNQIVQKHPQSAYTQGMGPSYEHELRGSSGLSHFRVNQDGFWNRYRGNIHKAPHTDSAYHVMYPSKDNTAYTHDQCRNDRRKNVRMSRYYARQIVNGTHASRLPASCY